MRKMILYFHGVFFVSNKLLLLPLMPYVVASGFHIGGRAWPALSRAVRLQIRIVKKCRGFDYHC